MIATDTVYEISNIANGLSAASYLSFATSGISLMNRKEPDIDDYNLKWFLFPIDGDQYIITSYAVNKNRVWNAHDNKINLGTYSSKISAQKWQIKNSSSGYTIENKNGKFLTAGTGESLGLVYLSDEIPADPNQQWKFTPMQTFSLPQPPRVDKTLADYPKFTKNGNIEDGTKPQLMGWTLIPCIMVNDPDMDTHTQITKTPYYIFKKYKYWQKAEGSNLVLLGGQEKEAIYEWGTDVEQKTTIKNKLSLQINEDSRFEASIPEVGSGTEDIRTQIIEELEMEFSYQNKEMKKYTERNRVVNSTDHEVHYVGFLTVTSLELYRMNSAVGIMSITTTDKNTYSVSRYPNDQEALLLLTNHSYEEVAAKTGIPIQILQELKNNSRKR